MAISYLSQPYESKVSPYQENIPLIAKVGEMKQNKYDNLLTTIFQQQNKLLDLDTLNQKVTETKKGLLKEMDTKLDSLVSTDLMLPGNIKKVESLFDPITENKSIIGDMYYTKQIRENQVFAKEALKKDPSVGNQMNYQTSQRLVDLYVKADPDQLSAAAPYAQLFTPYVSVKDKKTKFLTDLKVIKDGYDEEVTIIGENGIKYVKTTDGLIPQAKVLSMFYASLNPEDKQQLMLDGYHDFGNADLPAVMTQVKQNQEQATTLYSQNLKDIQGRMDILDKDGDGKVDVQDDDSGTNQHLLDSYSSQKSFYNQKLSTLSQRQKYIEKFDTNKDLNISDRMSMFSDIKLEELSNEMVTLLAIPEGLVHKYTFDASKIFDLKADLMKEDAKRKAEKDKAGEENTSKLIDYNGDNIADLSVSQETNVTNTPITTEDLIDENNIEDVKTPTKLSEKGVKDKNGNQIPSSIDISSANIKNYRQFFQDIYGNKAVDVQKTMAVHLRNMSKNPETNEVDKSVLEKTSSEYKVYKDLIGKKSASEIDVFTKDPKNKEQVEKFERLRQLEVNLNNAGSVIDIDKDIHSFIADKYRGALNAVADDAVFTMSDFLPQIDKNSPKYADITQEELKQIFDKLKDIPLKKSDTKGIIMDKIFKAVQGEKNPLLIAAVLNDMGVVGRLRDGLKNSTKMVAIKREKEYQGVYKALLDKNSYLKLTVSPPTGEAKKDDLYLKLNNAIAAQWRDAILVSGEKGKETKGTLFTSLDKLPAGYRSITYNTGTGELEAMAEGINGVIKVQLPKNSGEMNGLPWGVPTDDLLGKQLQLDYYLKNQKGDPDPMSKGLNITSIPSFGDIKVFYTQEGFKAGYYKGNTLNFLPLDPTNNSKALVSKVLQLIQSQGGDPQLSPSAYNILN